MGDLGSVDTGVEAGEADLLDRDSLGERTDPHRRPFLVGLAAQFGIDVTVLDDPVLGEDGLIRERLDRSERRRLVVHEERERVGLGLSQDLVLEHLGVPTLLRIDASGVQAVAVSLGHLDGELVDHRGRRGTGRRRAGWGRRR